MPGRMVLWVGGKELTRTAGKRLEEERWPWEDGGGDWSNVAASQGMPEPSATVRKQESILPRAFGGGTAHAQWGLEY